MIRFVNAEIERSHKAIKALEKDPLASYRPTGADVRKGKNKNKYHADGYTPSYVSEEPDY